MFSVIPFGLPVAVAWLTKTVGRKWGPKQDKSKLTRYTYARAHMHSCTNEGGDVILRG